MYRDFLSKTALYSESEIVSAKKIKLQGAETQSQLHGSKSQLRFGRIGEKGTKEVSTLY